jgi:hypothetical protein
MTIFRVFLYIAISVGVGVKLTHGSQGKQVEKDAFLVAVNRIFAFEFQDRNTNEERTKGNPSANRNRNRRRIQEGRKNSFRKPVYFMAHSICLYITSFYPFDMSTWTPSTNTLHILGPATVGWDGHKLRRETGCNAARPAYGLCRE